MKHRVQVFQVIYFLFKIEKNKLQHHHYAFLKNKNKSF
jgi:hypothetical protein